MSPRISSYGKRALTPALLSGAAYAASPDQVTNIFEPLSTPAESIYRAALLVLAVCAAIFVTVVSPADLCDRSIPPPLRG